MAYSKDQEISKILKKERKEKEKEVKLLLLGLCAVVHPHRQDRTLPHTHSQHVQWLLDLHTEE